MIDTISFNDCEIMTVDLENVVGIASHVNQSESITETLLYIDDGQVCSGWS